MRQRTGDAARTGHLAVAEVAAYVDGGLTEDERSAVESHLSACSPCCEEVLAVSRFAAASRAPEEQARRRRIPWAVVATAGAAAAIVLLIGRPASLTLELDGDVAERSAATADASIQLWAPDDGAVLGMRDVRLSWRSLGVGASRYEVVVMTEAGDSVWSATTRETGVRLPVDRLEGGRAYVWYVDALLEGGRTAFSGLRQFRVRR